MQAYTAMMSDPSAATRATADPVLRALRRTRQVRQFTDEPVTETDLNAILEVARWSGSSMNRQPWTFIVIRDRADRDRLAELAPSAKRVAGAAVAIAIAMRGDNPEWDAYDEGGLPSGSSSPPARSVSVPRSAGRPRHPDLRLPHSSV